MSEPFRYVCALCSETRRGVTDSCLSAFGRYVCTRAEGHAGPHAACGSSVDHHPIKADGEIGRQVSWPVDPVTREPLPAEQRGLIKRIADVWKHLDRLAADPDGASTLAFLADVLDDLLAKGEQLEKGERAGS